MKTVKLHIRFQTTAVAQITLLILITLSVCILHSARDTSPVRMATVLGSAQRPPLYKGFDINFFSVATASRYEHFLLPYSLFALHFHIHACAEIVVVDAAAFVTKYNALYNILQATFPGRFLVRTLNESLYNATKRLVQNPGNTIRFFEKPIMKSNFTYICDTDILTLESGIAGSHQAHMASLGLPYSNVIRNTSVPPSEQRLTGLHFVDTIRYYDSRFDVAIEKLIKRSSGSLVMDEIALQILCGTAFGLPLADRPDLYYRPVHGIHLSNNRGLDTGMPLDVKCRHCSTFHAVTAEQWFQKAVRASKTFELIRDRAKHACVCCDAGDSRPSMCSFRNSTYTSHWLKEFDAVKDDDRTFEA